MDSIADRASKWADSGSGDAGREADTPAQIPSFGWMQIALRTWKEASKDNVGIVAAGVAFYGFLAMVPLLGATVLTYGLVASPDLVLHNVQSLAKALPSDVAKLIGDQLLNVVKTSGGKKGLGLLVALLIALWGARNAAGSIVIALNIAYEEEEKRSWLKVNLLSLAITAAAVLLSIIGAAAIGVMARFGGLVPGLGTAGLIAGRIVAYLLLGATAAAAAATMYRYGPSRVRAKWTWITPGSLFFAFTWVVLTLGFGFYVSRFGKYNVTYGSLGGVIVLVTWLYLSSFVLLYGAEFNSEIEHQTAKDTTADTGDKPVGERGAWSADHVADGAADEGKESDPSGSSKLSDNPPPTHSPVLPTSTTPPARRQSTEHRFFVSRATNRVVVMAGMQKVGMLSAALSTIGLSLLRRRGRARVGAALLVAAAGVSVLRRED